MKFNDYVTLSPLCVPKPVTPIWFQRLSLQSWKWVYETCESYILHHEATVTVGQGLLIIEDSWLHTDTPNSERLLWTSNQPDAETSIWQHTTLTTDKFQFPRRDSNPQSQKRAAADRRLKMRGHRDRQGVIIRLRRTNKQTNKCVY